MCKGLLKSLILLLYLSLSYIPYIHVKHVGKTFSTLPAVEPKAEFTQARDCEKGVTYYLFHVSWFTLL